MDPNAFFDHLRRRVLGRPITFRRLAANTLLIYIDNDPGDGTGVTFWFDPIWHVREPGRVLAGSRQAQFDNDDDEEGIHRLGKRLDVLLGQTVQSETTDGTSRSSMGTYGPEGRHLWEALPLYSEPQKPPWSLDLLLLLER